MSSSLQRNHDTILAKERSLARTVAYTLVRPKPISVWEVTVLPILIFSYFNLKRTRELSAQNFLFTKELALGAALDMIKGGRSRQTAISELERKTRGVLAEHEKGIYSEEIRRQQMNEMGLLIDHYCKLLEAEGENYPSLILYAYQTKEEYVHFLEQLTRAEKEVNLAAQQTLGSENAAEVVLRLEEVTEKARMAETETIFGTPEDAE